MEDLNDVSPYLLLKTRVEAEVREDAAALLLAMSKPPKLAFCDYIAHRIHCDLTRMDPERIIDGCQAPKTDLHPEHGYFVSTTKTLVVTDRNKKRYRVTVEEIEHQTPCNLPMAECPICDNHEWHAAHARDESREGDE